MKKDDWPVTDFAIRPAGSDDKCLYCDANLGDEHNKNCVIRERTVILKCTITLVKRLPEDWDEKQINFHYNDGRWCADNIVTNIDNGPECLCPFTTIEYVREATVKDEEEWGVSVLDEDGEND